MSYYPGSGNAVYELIKNAMTDQTDKTSLIASTSDSCSTTESSITKNTTTS